MFLFITVQIFLYNCLIWILLVLIWWRQCSAEVSSSGGVGGGVFLFLFFKWGLQSSTGLSGCVCGTGVDWLIMLDRSLLLRGWPCAALICVGKGETLSVFGRKDTQLEDAGRHWTYLASSISAASSRGPFRASQEDFAFSKCFRL